MSAAETDALAMVKSTLQRPLVDGRFPPVLVTALRVERLAILVGRPGLATRRCGMGPSRAERAASRLEAELATGRPIIVAGVCGGLKESARPGQVVVATNVAVGTGPAAATDPDLTAAVVEALSGRGIEARLGAVVSVRRPVWGQRRSRLAASGSDVVDTETGYLLRALGRRPVAVVRVVSDVPGAGFGALPRSGLAALSTLTRVASALGRSENCSGTHFGY